MSRLCKICGIEGLKGEWIMKDCNFKRETGKKTPKCVLTSDYCDGEDNCILYQIYKNTEINR